MRLSRGYLIGVALIGIFIVSGCKEDLPTHPHDEELVVPSTYAFENVNFSGQSDRLDQLEELTAYMKTANTPGTQLDYDVMLAMFSNEGGNGGGNFSFTSDRQLKDKCFSLEVLSIENYMYELAIASMSDTTASNGVSGVMFSPDGKESRLFDANGRDLTQFIQKGLMGAVFYYQATSVYLGDDKMLVDNITVEDGEGTAMQHHMDEAYGYLGVSTDFPVTTSDVRFWGEYCNDRDAVLSTNEKLSLAFRTGRAAIDEARYADRDQAREDIREAWELVCAGTAIHYLNAAQDNLANDFERNHELSEGCAFIQNLIYNEGRIISESEIESILSTIGYNFYEVSASDLISARDKLAEIYDLENVKNQL